MMMTTGLPEELEMKEEENECDYCGKTYHGPNTGKNFHDIGFVCQTCYENKWNDPTGYCSPACCMGHGCDHTC